MQFWDFDFEIGFRDAYVAGKIDAGVQRTECAKRRVFETKEGLD
jgi:hypothetical protein